MSSGERFAKFEAWRHHPMLKPGFAHAVPGLKLGAGAFAVYFVCEKIYEKATGKGGAHGHGHGGDHGHGHGKH